MRRLAPIMLERGGFTVISASGPVEARRIAASTNRQIDLLPTDLVMPRRSGLELAQQLVVTVPTLRILFMSGYSDQAVVRHGALQHGTAFLEKPFTAEDLVHRVRETLDAS